MRADFIVKELDDIVLINAISRETIKENEVYTFALRLCDNDIDRDFERFGDSTLEELSPMFVGKAGIFDHRWSAKGWTPSSLSQGLGLHDENARKCRNHR